MLENLKNITGLLKNVYVETIRLNEPFIDLASRFSQLPGTVVLMSGGNLDSARFHMIAAMPWLSFKSSGTSLSLTSGDHTFHHTGDPFKILNRLVAEYAICFEDASIPAAAGLFGYLSYDLKEFIEVLPKTVMDDRHLPQMCLFAPSMVIVHDKIENKTTLCIADLHLNGDSTAEKTRAAFAAIAATRSENTRRFSGGRTGFNSSFTREDYLEAVRRIKDYIVSGHIYQVNLSQRFETDFEGDPFALFATLFEKAPAPFYAYIHAGDHQIVSTSMERFLLRKKSYVETRPIKGTRPRGKTKARDQAMAEELQNSKKDDAELSMIVDLMRNDLGRVCAGGSVKVAQHKRLEAYQNVFHLVSVVTGELQSEKNSVDLIKATFPGGSITGCPRIRSMEIIDELEPCCRHVYTGSIGYISFHDTLDLSIAIRTATVYRDNIFFSVGGGVVYDSDPEDEYHETLHKGRSLIDALQTDKKHLAPKEFVWQNGVIKPKAEAAVPVSDLGVQYGYGFFETIRVHNGKIGYLEDHIHRFYRAWDTLFQTPRPDLTWKDIILQVIEKNGFGDKTAAVKIMATFGEPDIPVCRHGLVVSARPYFPRPAIVKKGGLDMAVYPHPRQTPLAAHKTLNHLYYYLARKWARENSADEALILNPDGSISETNTANILILKGNRVIKPQSLAVLPGIMEEQVIHCLLQWGYELESDKLMPDDVYSADAVVITNSLIGAIPALSLNGRPVPQNAALCKRLCEAVLK